MSANQSYLVSWNEVGNLLGLEGVHDYWIIPQSSRDIFEREATSRLPAGRRLPIAAARRASGDHPYCHDSWISFGQEPLNIVVRRCSIRTQDGKEAEEKLSEEVDHLGIRGRAGSFS